MNQLFYNTAPGLTMVSCLIAPTQLNLPTKNLQEFHFLEKCKSRRV
jgi:hypothetical protein